MSQAPGRFALEFSTGPLVSIFAHAIILALLIFGLPRLPLPPEEPPAVEVELVAPVKDPPPKQEQKAEPAQPKPKPQPKAQQASQPPKTEQKPQPAPQPRLDARKIGPEQEKPKPQATMRPVLKFGEKDAASRNPVDGEAEKAIKTPTAKAIKEATAKPAPAQPDGTTPASMQERTAAPSPSVKPPAAAHASNRPRLQAADPDQVATTAMGKLARAERAGQLCVTELRRRLNNSNPPYWPDLLPAYRLETGNVLQVRKGAFRADARWYNLGFRCEVDADATVVISLSFEVGAPVPRAEWAGRGFPPM